jgi:uncharacterized protein YjbI with pentapeptide repeats
MSWRDASKWVWILVILGSLFIPVGAVLLSRHPRGAPNAVGEVFKDLGVALLTTGLIGWALFDATNSVEEERAQRAERSENRLFVMDASGTDRPRVFNGFDLRGQHLNGVQLPGVRFNETDLTEARLYEANLRAVDFIDATLVCSSLREADLTDPDNIGIGPDLRRAKLQGADLRGVQFGNADLENAEFGDASGDLSYSDSHPTDLRGANLRDVENIESARFEAVIYGEYNGQPTMWPAGFDPPPSAPLPDERSWPLCTPAIYTVE